MHKSGVGQGLAIVAAVVLRRRALVVAAVALLVGFGALLGSRLVVNTDRYDMVAPDHAYQAKMLEFFQHFGYPDAIAIVVRGGDENHRRSAVDMLTRQLAQHERFRDRVLGRLDADLVSRTVLLAQIGQQPTEHVEQTAALLQQVRSAGLAGVADGLAAQLLTGLEQGAEGDASRLQMLARAVGALEAMLRAQSDDEQARARSQLSQLVPAEMAEPRVGLDSAGYFVAGPDAHLVAVFPKLSNHEVESLRDEVQPLREARDAVAASVDPDVEILITGIPALTLDEHGLVARGMIESSVATAIGIALLLAVAFRSLRTIIVTLTPLGLGMVVTCGAVQLVYGELNPITSAMFALLLGLGVDFAVHLVGRFHESRRAGESATVAVTSAYRFAGPGVLTGALTTVLVFLTITAAEFSAFAELGFNSAIGITIILAVTFVSLPLLLARAGGERRAAPPEFPGLRHVTRWVRRRSKLVVVAALLLGGLGVALSPRLQFNSRYFDFLPQSVESSRALGLLEATPNASPVLAFAHADSIEEARQLTERLRQLPSVGHVDSVTDLLPELTAERREQLRRIVSGLDSADSPAGTPSVGPGGDGATDSTLPDAATSNRDDGPRASDRSASATKNIGAFHTALTRLEDALDEVCFALEQHSRDARPCIESRDAVRHLKATVATPTLAHKKRFAELDVSLRQLAVAALDHVRRLDHDGAYQVADIPDVLRHRFVAHDGSGLVAVYIYPRHSIWDAEAARTFAEEVTAVAPNAAGHAITMHVHTQMIVRDFQVAAALACVLVFVVLWTDFRHLGDALLALFPVVLGWSWMLGALVLSGGTLNAANIVALPLVLGVGVDAGVHVTHRLRQSASEHHGTARLGDLVAGTGSPVVIASLTTIMGFAGLILPDHGGMQSLGALMMLGTGCSLVASVLVLPAVLVQLGRAR